MKKLNIKNIILFLFSGLLFISCGKKQENKLDPALIMLYEHDFREQEEEEKVEEPAVDKEGFTIVDDTVYVISEVTSLKSGAQEISDGIYELKYGDELKRLGHRSDGWNKVEINGNSGYIYQSDITEMKLDISTEFTYTVASLDIVDTTRQFYSYDDLCSDLVEIRKKFPKLTNLSVVGLTSDHRNILEMTIGNPEAEKNIMIIGGMEGCEYMTSLFAAKLCEYYAHYSKEGIYNGYSYSELLDQCCIHIIPMLNPDGVSVSQFNMDGISSERIKANLQTWFERDQTAGGANLLITNYLMLFLANAEGAEITKNFPYKWESANSTEEPGNRGYKGKTAASEPETVDIMKLIDLYSPDVIVNLRTTGNRILHKFGAEAGVSEECLAYASLLSDKFSYELDDIDYSEVTGGSLEGYAACEKKIPIVRICLGNGDAPLFLNEYNNIWSSGREFPAAMMVYAINTYFEK